MSAFQDPVDAELIIARENYPPRQRHLEAAAYISEYFDEYLAAVRSRHHHADKRPLVRALVRVAAMAQRAAEDLRLDFEACGQQLHFADLVTDELPQLIKRLGAPLNTSHAASMWLKYAVRRYEDAIEQGICRQSPKLALDLLVEIAARCHVICEDLGLLRLPVTVDLARTSEPPTPVGGHSATSAGGPLPNSGP